MASDTGDTASAAAHDAEAEPAADAATVAPANAPFQPEDEEMHISPHPPKRPLDGTRSPNVDLSYDEPVSKRSRVDGAQGERRSRSPVAISPPKNKSYRERSRSQDRSRDRNRDRSRSHSQRYTKSPETRRSQRDSTPPFSRRRSSGASAAIPEPESRDIRRKADISQEERKRGQRLFGGLFNALGQPTARARTRPGPGGPGGSGRPGGPVNKQPAVPDGGWSQSIADRQQERPQATEEDRKKETERLAKLERARNIEQVKFDEKKMHTVHANELMRAGNLSTKSKPSLLYRPKSLTEKQKQTIESQVQAANDRISKQRRKLQSDIQASLAALNVRTTPREAFSEAGRPQMVGRKVVPAGEYANEDTDMASTTSSSQRGRVHKVVVEGEGPNPPLAEIHAHDLHDDKDKGIMVEHEEDTVIY
ncbi:hypothetical protein Sste5346_000584 [Sporothrix stenoceras]|uniref:Pinin/SDK/MemA protein domain-containing protein n=1 Tax=Sporothrix stenoceras TaxID=5173 RepID=A0ABR3ZSW6_9PEZI